ncbi:ribosomal protein S18-alanine N-acetyltransferase [[Eubacterium] cellulosolvens]
MQLVGVTLGENYHPSFYINLHNFWPEGFIVATLKEQIVGFILTTISESKTARILMLSVYPYYQRRGIASTLMEAALNQCIKRDIKVIKLEVRTHNQKAIQFYRKYGFVINQTLMNYYKNGDNAYLMYKYI